MRADPTAFPALDFKALYRCLRGLTEDERTHVASARRRFNAATVHVFAAACGAIFLFLWLGVERGAFVDPASPLRLYYRLSFGAETLLSLGYLVYRARRADGRGAGAYLSAALLFIVALNLLGMRAVGDRSIYQMSLMLCAFIYSAPFCWYLAAFPLAWAASLAGMIAWLPPDRLLGNATVLAAMTLLSLLTALIIEAHRIAAETLALRLWASNRELTEMSLRDPLTGLFNRRFLVEWLLKELSRAERDRDQNPIVLALIDLDRFKEINDEAGHGAGDVALKAAANAFRAELRRADVVARYGGDEFIAVLTGTTVDQAKAGMERCLESIRTTAIDGCPIPLTFSCGLAAWRSGQSAAELIAEADGRLYRAKELGRNRVVAEPVTA